MSHLAPPALLGVPPCPTLSHLPYWVSLLRPHPITSACPPLWTPKPMSVPAISDPLHHNPTHSALHPSRTPSHHPSDPPDFCAGASPPCPFVLLAIGRVPMTVMEPGLLPVNNNI